MNPRCGKTVQIFDIMKGIKNMNLFKGKKNIGDIELPMEQLAAKIFESEAFQAKLNSDEFMNILAGNLTTAILAENNSTEEAESTDMQDQNQEEAILDVEEEQKEEDREKKKEIGDIKNPGEKQVLDIKGITNKITARVQAENEQLLHAKKFLSDIGINDSVPGSAKDMLIKGLSIKYDADKLKYKNYYYVRGLADALGDKRNRAINQINDIGSGAAEDPYAPPAPANILDIRKL
jgi:hypothetical protein